jgi:hypothetical protein
MTYDTYLQAVLVEQSFDPGGDVFVSELRHCGEQMVLHLYRGVLKDRYRVGY